MFVRNEKGLYLPEWLETRPTAIDLFAGCGGFSLGFMTGGFQVLAALDNDGPSLVTYMMNLGTYPCEIHFVNEEDKVNAEKALEKASKNGGNFRSGSGWISRHPHVPGVGHFWLGDIRKVTGAEILDTIGLKVGEVDCIMGGPPCQGFSVSGKRQVMDPRNSLVFEFCRMIIEIKPKMFVFENVPGILSMVTQEGVPVVDAICRVLEDGGFAPFKALKKSLLNSSGAGAALKSGHSVDEKRKEDGEEKEVEMALF